MTHSPRFSHRPVTSTVVLLGALALVTAGGCSPGERHPARDDAGRTALTFWNGFTGPDGVTMTHMVDEFQRENPDVVVNMQFIPWSTYYNKLTLSMAYGGEPDVFVVQSTHFAQYASCGVLRPLADAYASGARPLTKVDFAAQPWQQSFYNGKQYGLPLDIWPMGLYYNAKLFRDAGIVDSHGNAKPPTTAEEFLVDAQKLTVIDPGQSQPRQWGFAFTDLHYNWLTIAEQFGGGMVTADGRRGAMSSPGSLAATRLMCDMIGKYHVAPRPAQVNSWLLFREGKIAMTIQGIYMLADLQKQQGLEYAGAPVPTLGPVQSTMGGSHMLCEPAGASPERAKAAWRLMRFLTDHSYEWAAGGQVAARSDVLRSEPFAKLPVQSEFAREVTYVQYEPQVPKGPSLSQFVDPAIESCLDGLQSPEDAMRDADRRIDQLLSRD